jgi:methylmalonyl-CoA mutase C-terminal domain/subunit
MTQERKVRIMVAKPGLDGHDRGAKVIARGFRDSGFEVIYTGLHQTPEQIVSAAIQEDVDAIGLSSLAGAHNRHFLEVLQLLRERGADDIVVFGGGIIPEEDIARLKQAGVKEIFTPGTPVEHTVRWVKENVRPRGNRQRD